jgi:hypothetical protein
MIDARMGQSLTTGSLEAVEQYQLAVDRILGSETGAAEALDRALALVSGLRPVRPAIGTAVVYLSSGHCASDRRRPTLSTAMLMYCTIRASLKSRWTCWVTG